MRSTLYIAAATFAVVAVYVFVEAKTILHQNIAIQVLMIATILFCAGTLQRQE